MNFYPVRAFFLCSLFFLQACATQQSTENSQASVTQINRVVTTEGKAKIIKGAKLTARKQAFKNAISNATIQLNHLVSSKSLLGSTKVVDEWIDDEVYHLQVLSVISDSQKCVSPYRKSIVVTGFPIATSGQVSGNETQDLYSGIPREIMNILVETGNFIGHNNTHTVLYSRPDMAPEMISSTGYQDSTVVQLAQDKGAQFVMSGVIRDLEVESTEYVRGSGFMSQVKSAMRDFVARRGLSIDVYVHDGINGTLLFQHRYTDTIIGDVWIPSGYTVGSERFKSTPAGHKISKIIHLASKDIGQLFACYPFSAEVLKVQENKIFFAAGAQDKLKLGDRLVVYAVNSNSGFQEKSLIGVVNVQEVQSKYSVGVMEIVSDARKVKAGDLVKSW
ncbi:MAG: hypothetical protein L3J59_05020 [Methylococcaceae bacterium]|nr:hypothetical protein [Methylococcaceae bacterium]